MGVMGWGLNQLAYIGDGDVVDGANDPLGLRWGFPNIERVNQLA